MTKIYGRCPRCRSRIKINNAERMDGRKIVCRGCRRSIRIQAPKTAVAGGEIETFRLVEFVDEDGEEPATEPFADEAEPEYRPLPRARRPAKKKQASRADADEQETTFVADAAGGQGEAKRNPLVLVVGGLAGLLLVSLIVGGILLLRSGIGKATKYEPPTKYVRFAPKGLALSATVPQDWAQTYAGGESGIPITARFTSGSISVNIRESVGGGALGQAAIAIQGAAPGVPKEAPVVGIHAYHRQHFEEDYRDYQEEFERPIKTRGYGEGRISDFTASEGLFGMKIKGCRATVMNPIHQFTVTCKCPPGQFQDVRPVFEKIINSMSTGGD